MGDEIALVLASLPLVKQLLGPSLDVVGEYLASRIRVALLPSQIQMLRQAESILRENNIKPARVPAKILIPILEGVAVEEEDSIFNMPEQWAALLTNAANPAFETGVLPSFPEILKQLSPKEAYILDATYGYIIHKSIPLNDWGKVRVPVLENFENVCLTKMQLKVAIQNLERLGLIEMMKTSEYGWESQFSPTEFGYTFALACMTPNSKIRIRQLTLLS